MYVRIRALLSCKLVFWVAAQHLSTAKYLGVHQGRLCYDLSCELAMICDKFSQLRHIIQFLVSAWENNGAGVNKQT